MIDQVRFLSKDLALGGFFPFHSEIYVKEAWKLKFSTLSYCLNRLTRYPKRKYRKLLVLQVSVNGYLSLVYLLLLGVLSCIALPTTEWVAGSLLPYAAAHLFSDQNFGGEFSLIQICQSPGVTQSINQSLN